MYSGLMPLIPLGFADISLQFQSSATPRPAFVTFGVATAETDPMVLGLAVQTATIAASSFMSKMDNGVTLTAVHVSLGTTNPDEPLHAVFPSTTAGSIVLGSPPPNVAVLMHKRTARGGRRGRGRLFVPWYCQATDISEAGIIAATPLAGIQTAMTTWLGLLAPNQMVILHSVSAPGVDEPTTPGTPNIVTSLTADRLVATQRRRLGR